MTTDDTVSDYEKGPQVADYGKGDDTVRQPSAKFRPDLAKDTVTATLAEWAALTEGATEGPWTPEREGDPAFPDATEFWWVASDTVPLGTRGDAEFIATSRAAMPALLGFVEDVRAAASEPNISPDYRGDAYDQGWQEGRDDMAQRIEQAARKWIGGEGT